MSLDQSPTGEGYSAVPATALEVLPVIQQTKAPDGSHGAEVRYRGDVEVVLGGFSTPELAKYAALGWVFGRFGVRLMRIKEEEG